MASLVGERFVNEQQTPPLRRSQILSLRNRIYLGIFMDELGIVASSHVSLIDIISNFLSFITFRWLY